MPAWGQAPEVNPVYVDDAPLAGEALALAPALLDSGNAVEAVRVIQRLLDESGDLLIEHPRDPGRFEPVRERVHELLLEREELLTLYRRVESARAQRDLEVVGAGHVERTRLLTPAGLDAALRVAQGLYEDGQFDGALLVLAQLDRHPDIGSRRVEAAGLLAGVLRHVDRDDARALLAAWGGERNLGPIEPPAGVAERVQTAMDDAGEIDLTEMVGSPLHSIDLPGLQARGDDEVDFSEFEPWVMPAVTSEEIIVNDGERVMSVDRFTFERRWVAQAEGWPGRNAIPGVRQRGRTTPDAQMQGVSAAVVRGNLVAAITGWVVSYGRGGVATRFGDPRLHAIERTSGRVLWSWHPVQADVEMAQAMLVGRPIIDGGVVFVQARKQIASRRSLGLYVYALDAHRGEVLWSRLVASAGSLPYQTQGGVLVGDMTLHEGVLYVAGEVGIVAAIEAWSGRFRWLRVHAGMTFAAFDPAPAHALGPPVIAGKDLFTLSGDRSRILRIDVDRGVLLGERDARGVGEPRYLLGVGGTLVGVGDLRLTFFGMEGFERAGVRMAEFPAGTGVVGRVVVAGDTVLTPLDTGVLMVSARDPSARRMLALDESGMLTPMSGQLVVAGSTTLHGYLVWSVAERVLSRRMEEEWDDPSPALTFAQLSVQAGRTDRLIEALDRALRAIEGVQDAVLAGVYRERLFSMVLSMARGGASAELAGALLDRLERAARSPAQRVAALIERAEWHERRGESAGAIEALQRVLLDGELSGASWPGPRLSVRADLEATRRLREVVARDAEVYARYEAAARSELARLGRDATPDALEDLARRYPASSAAGEAWLRAGDAHRASGQGHLAVRALRQGLQAGDATRARGELTGRLIEALVEQGRWGEAKRAIASLPTGVSATTGGSAIDLERVRTRVEGEIAARFARPRIGDHVTGVTRTHEGWRIAPALLESEFADAGYVPCERTGGGAFRLGVLREGGAGVTWEQVFARESRLIRADPEALLVLEIGGGAGALAGGDGAPEAPTVVRVHRLDARDGRVLWTGETPAPATTQTIFGTPMDGPVRADELVVSADGLTLVLASRSGQAWAISLDDGREIWRARTPMDRVHDIAMGAGMLVMGGQTGEEAMLLAMDARSGEALFSSRGGMGEFGGQVRWVRASPDGRIIAGLDGGVLSTDPLAGELSWLNDDRSMRATLDAWSDGERMLVLGAERDLWALSLESGRVDGVALATRDTTFASSAIGVFRGEGGLVVASSRGFVVLDGSDLVVGADAIPAGDSLLTALATGSGLVTIDREAMPSGASHAMYILDWSGRIVDRPVAVELGRNNPPRAMGVLNDEVLISTDRSIVVLGVPRAGVEAGGS